MKKLYRKGAVHPSPPSKLDQLTFLPTAILTLAAALSPEEKEVLAYLISCSNTSGNSFSNNKQHHRRASSSSSSFARSSTPSSGDHPPSFKCDCFRCYMSYWARWDSSPNRQLIHEIIEAFEDWLVQSSTQSKKSRKERKKKGSDSNNSNSNSNIRSNELKQSETSQKNELAEPDSVIESSSSGGGDGGGGSSGAGDGDEGEGEGKGSVRRLMNYIGERIWGVWGSSV